MERPRRRRGAAASTRRRRRAFDGRAGVFANTSAPGAEGAYRFGKPEGDYRGLRSYARELMRRLYDECNETDAAPGLWNVRRCGDAGVREIVVAGTCTNPTHRGASGPCCRANSAMRLFVDRATTTFAKVKWFFFSDDDVYFRSRALLGLLARRDPADPAAALAAAPTGRGIVNYCRGPAEHYLAGKPWHVVSGLSRAALVERVAAGVRRNAAGAQCDALKMVGHDVGLGFFAWMYALDVAMLAPLPVTRRDKARPGPPMFNYAAIFNPERNFSADQIAAETKSTGDFTAVRREIARFHFFHCARILCRGAYDMFRYLRSLGDDEAGDDFVFPDPPVYHHRGFACTAYARRHDVSAASAEPWVPFNATTARRRWWATATRRRPTITRINGTGHTGPSEFCATSI